MNNKELFKSIGNVDEDMIVEASTARHTKRSKKIAYTKWGMIAACAALVLGIAIVKSPLSTTITSSPQISQQAPVSAPNGVRKILNYNGYRYAFVADGAQFKFSGVKLNQSLGTVDNASTFATGGELYEIPSYPNHFRIAVKFEANYYLAEIVAKIDDSAMTAKEYLDLANLNKNSKDIYIMNHVGNDVLKKMTDQPTVASILKGLYSAKNATLSNKEYEAIAEAQSQGKSYLLKLNQKDGTSISMYIIPELKVVSIGDAYYHLPDDFFDQAGELFTELKQEVLPLY